MSLKRAAAIARRWLRAGMACLTLFQFSMGAPLAGAQSAASAKPQPNGDAKTTTPIKHVIVIIGENRSFDHVFATYVPKPGQTVMNLLSEGIVNADGTPGPNFSKVEQSAAVDRTPDAFLLSPPKVPFPNEVMPAPLVGGPRSAVSFIPANVPLTNPPKARTAAELMALAEKSENGLPPNDVPKLLTGGTLLTNRTPDTRIANATALPPGPFQITGKTLSYDDYVASPVHRFYQMWQQMDCSTERSTAANPSGCDARLFPWVETTVGPGGNGTPQAANFSVDYAPAARTTGEGSTAMGFYNMQQGDAPYFKSLADQYAMSDNFHQSVAGGTGVNHVMLGHGDDIWYSDGKGHPLVPPHGVKSGAGSPSGNPAVLDEIENPNPQNGTNNWYTEDGYGIHVQGSTLAIGGGSYSDCADATQPGVATIVNYLKALHIDPRCEPGHYYLLNNYNPGYFGQGEDASTDNSPNNSAFTVPPSSTPSIGDDMIAHNVTWKYYGDQWNEYAGNAQLGIPEDKYQINWGPVGSLNSLKTGVITSANEYCNICNPFQYDTSIMADAAVRAAHIQDTTNLYADIQNGTLPAVSFVKPSGLVDGHPASSKLGLFEGFTQKIVTLVQNSAYWKDTAIFITFDEGGGYYDSGYVQPLDFFGDGTRIPLIVVSPYATGGRIAHNYSDHVSILKFIERNWNLPRVTDRSRDNFPNPIASAASPYVPSNAPAISDLFELFDFGQSAASSTKR